MKILRNLMLCGCVVAVAACTNMKTHSEVQALNEARAVGSPFTQHLTDEYRNFSNREMDAMMDYPDALHFARKGLAAANGESVLPEPVSDWNLLPEHIEELGTARGRLLAALDQGGREIAPQQSAIAQARFDCWIEQQEENWQEKDIANCKTQFIEAMNNLEGIIKPQPESMPPVTATEVPDASQPMKTEDAMYLVFFDFDRATIGANGASVIGAVIEEIKGRNLNMVHVVGHTDSSGPKSYNNKLAVRRANAVRDALTSQGVDPSIMNIEGRGEDQLMVKTPDGVREPANRRAEITFK